MVRKMTVVNKPKVYACKNKDDEIRLLSTSGGIFTAFAEKILEQNGIIFAVRFDENFMPIYDFVEYAEQLSLYRGSKYVQAIPGKNIVNELERRLQMGQKALFIGTPCVANGIKKRFRDYESQLYVIDFICMGVVIPDVWKAYKSHAFENEILEKIVFKEKSNGWRRYNFYAKTDKQELKEFGQSNPFMKGYLHKLYLRPTCYKCMCKGFNRFSDITIADCWGIEDVYPKFDDDMGISSVFLNSKLGTDLFTNIKDKLEIKEISFELATKKNHYYFDSAERNYYQDDFFREFYEGDPYSAILKYQDKTRPIWLKISNRFFHK